MVSIHPDKIIALLLCLAIPCQATITRIQSAQNSNSGTSVVVTLGGAPADGNFLVMTLSDSQTVGSRISSISQTGATWVKAVESVNASGEETEIWYAESVSGAGTAVTINFATSFNGAAIVVEYSGVAPSSSLDQTATNTGTTTTGVDSGTTATTATANELWIAALGHTIATTSSAAFNAFTNSFSQIGDQTIGVTHVVAAERIVSATGAANTTGSYAVNPFGDVWAGAVATFKERIAANTYDPTLLLFNGED